MRTRHTRDLPRPAAPTPRSLRARLALAGAVVALALTGCASLDGGGTGAGPTTPEPEPVAPGGESEPDAPLLTVEQEGGFVMMGHDFASVPMVTVYPDGRAITHGPMIAIYPGPALPNLQLSELSEDEVAELVDAARDAGLLQEVTYGDPPTADVPTTVVTLRVEGETYVHTAPSLGVGDGTMPRGAGDDTLEGDPAAGEDMAGVSEEEQAARQALSDFIATAQDMAATGAQESYRADSFAVMARVATEGAQEPTADGIERQVAPWPLALDLATASECVVVDGADAQTLREALVDANQLTLWEQDGQTYEVWFRPLLPGEDGCDDV